MNTKTLVGVIAGLSLLVAACGDDNPQPAAAVAETTLPVTESATEPTTDAATTDTGTTDTGTTDTAQAVANEVANPPLSGEDGASEFPSAIISLSPTATEMLYAIGAGDQVLAVDDFSNYPAETVDKMQGLSGYTPNVEAIAGLSPDLVVTDGTNAELLGQLDSLDIPHWEGPAAVSFDDVYAQIEQLGAATGHISEAAELVGQMQTGVAAVKDGLPELAEPLTYYHELDPTFFSVTSDTFIGAVYTEIGLVNIADAVGDGNPYPQLNAEFIVAENPDLIFLACTLYCGETAETVAARSGWEAMSAIVNGGVIEMNDDIASRWGPRIVEYLQVAGDAVARAAALQPAG